MARYIDADELRRRVKEKTNPYGKPTLDYESGVKVLNMIDNAHTADVAPRAEWISVDERLPDENGRFLTVDEKGDMMVCYWEEHFGWFAMVCNKNAITHWMPLPEPPGTKGGE